MGIYLIVLGVFLIAFLGMAIGVILSNRCLKGSCGGLSTMTDEHGRSMCESCTTPKDSCPTSKLRQGAHEEADEEAHV